MTRSKRPDGAPGLLKRLWPKGLWADPRGGIATIAAVVVPVAAVLTCGAIDLAGVNADRSALQDAADATALAMAKQLGVATNAGITARAQDYAQGQLGQLSSQDQVSIATTIAQDNSSVTVAISGKRPSFFGNLLPPGGWRLGAQATASSLGEIPLCVLASGAGGGGAVDLEDSPTLSAGHCLVQSNADMTVAGAGNLSAGLAQASGQASGPITPTPQAGAPAIADPFATLSIQPPPLPVLCLLDLTATLNILAPTTHCGNITVGSGQTLVLLPGVHYFAQGGLHMTQNSTLQGSNVVLVFDDDANFTFADSSVINLSGRQTGTYAGFVIVTTRSNTNTFSISSDSAHKLEGAVYIPSATLQITGTGNKVADQSPWTVIVAQSLEMTGSPNLVVNANYASSSVPVPAGAGSNYQDSKVVLSK